MEISDQLKEAARALAQRHLAEGLKLPAEIPGNAGMCLGTEAERHLLSPFGTFEHEGTTYLIGPCL